MSSLLRLTCFAALLLALGTAACFDDPAPACSLACGEAAACPSGYVCGAGDVCHRLLDDGTLATCDLPTPDAAPADAAVTADAAP